MRGHSEEFPFMCICGTVTKTYDEMMDHYMQEHPVVWSAIKEPKEWECK